MTVAYDILTIVCINLPCVSECMYVCMCDVCHDIHIPCTRYVAIHYLYLCSLPSFVRVVKVFVHILENLEDTVIL